MILGTTKIDRHYWLVVLPDGGNSRKDVPGSQFNKMIELAGGDTAFHTEMATMCKNSASEERHDEDGYWRAYGHVTRYDSDPVNWDLEEMHYRSLAFGFRPVLVPLKTAAGAPDDYYMAAFKDGEVIEMGTLYMNGEPLLNPIHPIGCKDKHCASWKPEADVPAYIDGRYLQIGNTHPDKDKRIRFVKVGNCFVSDRVLIGNISYNDLKEHLLLKKYRGPKALVAGYHE